MATPNPNKFFKEKYEVEGTLGAGGMGVVYKGRHKVTGRPVAIKAIKPMPNMDAEEFAEAKKRFELEAKAMGKIADHPNIVSIIDADEVNGAPYMVMQLVNGPNLGQFLQTNGGILLPNEAKRIAVPVAEAVDYMNKKGFTHRDLKPENILIGEQGPVIADLGLVKVDALSGNKSFSDSMLSITQEGMSVGTPRYMAPEQVLGENDQSKADIWATGTILYQMLTGHTPFGDDPSQPIMAIMQDIATEKVILPSHYTRVPKGLEKVVMKALQKNPADRFNIGELSEAIKDSNVVAYAPRRPQVTRREDVVNPGKRNVLKYVAGGLGISALASLPFLGSDESEQPVPEPAPIVEPVRPEPKPQPEIKPDPVPAEPVKPSETRVKLVKPNDLYVGLYKRVENGGLFTNEKVDSWATKDGHLLTDGEYFIETTAGVSLRRPFVVSGEESLEVAIPKAPFDLPGFKYIPNKDGKGGFFMAETELAVKDYYEIARVMSSVSARDANGFVREMETRMPVLNGPLFMHQGNGQYGLNGDQIRKGSKAVMGLSYGQATNAIEELVERRLFGSLKQKFDEAGLEFNLDFPTVEQFQLAYGNGRFPWGSKDILPFDTYVNQLEASTAPMFDLQEVREEGIHSLHQVKGLYSGAPFEFARRTQDQKKQDLGVVWSPVDGAREVLDNENVKFAGVRYVVEVKPKAR